MGYEGLRGVILHTHIFFSLSHPAYIFSNRKHENCAAISMGGLFDGKEVDFADMGIWEVGKKVNRVDDQSVI